MSKLSRIVPVDDERLTEESGNPLPDGAQHFHRDHFRPSIGHIATLMGIVVIVVGFAAGLFARFYGLGNRPLTTDEYYFIRSVGFILERDIPQFPTGGYYIQGILPQYLTAASILVFGKTGFAYRLPSVLFSLASVILLYIYSRASLGKILASALALTLFLSSWHIEFARFARMYSAFQCATLLFLIAVNEAFFKEKWHLRYFPHMTLFMAYLTHAISVLLSPFLFIPLVTGRTSRQFLTSSAAYRFGAVSIFTALVGLFFSRFDFRSYGVINPLPKNYMAVSEPALRLPAFPFWSVSDSALINLGFLCALLIFVTVVLLIWKHMWKTVKTTDIILTLLMISTALHAFLIACACFILLLCRYDIHRFHLHPRKSYILLGISFLIGISWLAFAYMTRDWIQYVDDGAYGMIWSLRRTFFGWPDLYMPIYLPWSQELPLLGMFAIGALLYQIVTKLKNPLSVLLRHPAFVILSVVTCFGILYTPQNTTRYVFFIYPVILYLIALSIAEITKQLGGFFSWSSITSLELGAAIVYLQ